MAKASYNWDYFPSGKFTVYEDNNTLRTIAECTNELDAVTVTNALNAYK